MSSLPHDLYRADQVRELDRRAITQHGIDGYTLMTRAGHQAFECMRQRWPAARELCVLCGPGNNGGDGYVLARLAHEQGIQVSVLYLVEPQQLKGDARRAYQDCDRAGVNCQSIWNASIGGDVIIDGLFGTGLSRPLDESIQRVIHLANQARAPRFALDIPSGIDADTGAVLGAAIEADAAISFIGLKPGLFTGAGRGYSGQVYFSDLDVPPAIYEGQSVPAQRMGIMDLPIWGAPRPRHAHKGRFGHVLVIGGNHGMAGAARLAAEAAARTGSGLVSVATRREPLNALVGARPELMVHAVEQGADLHELLKRATVIAIGPGLGQDAWAQEMLGLALQSELPLVVDADGLNLLAAESARRDNWILTPHPGEAARLLGSDSQTVEQDRFGTIRQLVQTYGGVCVLKGAGSLIDDGNDPVTLIDAGNPGMASGGMGDVLTGVIAGLLAQGMSLSEAAQKGALAHALAGDCAALEGERGLLASDVIGHLRAVLNSD